MRHAYADLEVQWGGGICIFMYDGIQLNCLSLDNLCISIDINYICQSTYIQATPPYFYLIVIRGYEIA
jgi:hypothetical protein